MVELGFLSDWDKGYVSATKPEHLFMYSMSRIRLRFLYFYFFYKHAKFSKGLTFMLSFLKILFANYFICFLFFWLFGFQHGEPRQHWEDDLRFVEQGKHLTYIHMDYASIAKYGKWSRTGRWIRWGSRGASTASPTMFLPTCRLHIYIHQRRAWGDQQEYLYSAKNYTGHLRPKCWGIKIVWIKTLF